VLLFDEPLAALDRKLREQMQVEIKLLQRSVGITTIFVTHDQDEALTLSDSFCVDRFRGEFLDLMRSGKLDIVFANESELKSLYETSDFESAVAALRNEGVLGAVTRSEHGCLVVTREETTTTYTGPTVVLDGGTLHASGGLLEDGVTPVPGRMLTFTLGSGSSAQTCTGSTDASGNAAEMQAASRSRNEAEANARLGRQRQRPRAESATSTTQPGIARLTNPDKKPPARRKTDELETEQLRVPVKSKATGSGREGGNKLTGGKPRHGSAEPQRVLHVVGPKTTAAPPAAHRPHQRAHKRNVGRPRWRRVKRVAPTHLGQDARARDPVPNDTAAGH
jgi:hypothetical protein